MKIFILEDDEQRILAFKRSFGQHNLYIVSNVNEAIILYKKHKPFDVVLLDHDLGGRTHVSSFEENTGYQFAKYLSLKKEKPNVVFHSWNVPGVEKMKEFFPRAPHIPFGSRLLEMFSGD